MKFIIIIYTTNKLTVVEMEDIRGVRLRKFKLRKIVLGVRMHFHHNCTRGVGERSLNFLIRHWQIKSKCCELVWNLQITHCS